MDLLQTQCAKPILSLQETIFRFNTTYYVLHMNVNAQCTVNRKSARLSNDIMLKI